MVKIELINMKDRHSAITDGVFAIAMTILVLEIAVPTISDISSGVALSQYFTNYLAPAILIYFISFYLVYTFWENTILLFTFKRVSNPILTLNMIAMATVCLIPFATGFLFEFYMYKDANIFFSALILIISLLYVMIFLLLVRLNFKKYFEKKEEIKASIHESYDDGVEFSNLKLYVRGVTLTLFYLLLTPVIGSLISLVLAFISPLASIMSFIVVLILRFAIRMKRTNRDQLQDIKITDDEREFLDKLRESIYGDE
ncbi:MAG: DUF1211 domain-containing protein [Methanobrevibacter sp.]|uniref:TMEM175 family protein n=1 Tax=Methanobrevibacter sp. TaxID=66852 RepID=UPI001B166F11|nr:TMEM175 family protein [Methanobrevibacter sp.]MBO5152539.1 DUF1211 domain-containing protein [Methanobrevibacter sp.]